MPRGFHFSILVSVLCAWGCGRAPVGDFAFPEGTVQHVVRADDMPWAPCPPHLPPDCEIAVLEGNPNAPGLFSVRFRLEEGSVMPPHTHPRDERVTVLEGRVSVAFGLDGSPESATPFGPGDYYVNARNAIHTVWADETSVVQITGMGPWEAHFVNAADDRFSD